MLNVLSYIGMSEKVCIFFIINFKILEHRSCYLIVLRYFSHIKEMELLIITQHLMFSKINQDFIFLKFTIYSDLIWILFPV